MLCERCKENSATIHYQQIVNGEKKEYYLCEKCAEEIQGGLSFDTMFKGILDSFINMGVVSGTKSGLLCSSCKMSFDEFKESGKLGCANCYKDFKSYFAPILKNIQGSTRHMGKIPKKAGAELYTKRKIENMKAELKKAVEKEEYEKAANLRDKIKDLERNDFNE